MKKVYKYILFLFFFSITKSVFSQLSFSVDSLHVSNVLWLCQNDVVITHFAYGPNFDMRFSIKNSWNDTISIPWEKIHVYISYTYKKKRWQKETITEIKTTDSILVLYPNSTISFSGYNFLVLDGVTTTGLNYRLVNFLPEIDNIVKYSKLILEIEGMGKTITSFKNCFTDKAFFIDGTHHESIFDSSY